MNFPPNPYVEKKAREFSKVRTLDEAVMLAESLGITVDFWPKRKHIAQNLTRAPVTPFRN